MKYFVVVRDTTERGRDLDQVLTQYMTFVKPAFEEFCSPVSDFFVYFSSIIWIVDQNLVSDYIMYVITPEFTQI